MRSTLILRPVCVCMSAGCMWVLAVQRLSKASSVMEISLLRPTALHWLESAFCASVGYHV